MFNTSWDGRHSVIGNSELHVDRSEQLLCDLGFVCMYSLTILRYLQLSSVKTIGVIFHVLFAIRFNITYLCCLPYCSCGIYKPIWADWYDMLPASLNSDKLCWFPFGTGPCCDDGEFDQTKTNCICLVIHWPVIYSTSFFYTCKWAPYGICVGIFPFQFSFMFLCLFLYL